MRTQMVMTPLGSTEMPVEIGRVQLTRGIPNWEPKPDQLPFAYDQNANVLYFYSDAWNAYGFSTLPELDLSNITNLADSVKVPIFYEVAGQKIEGYLTLKEFKSILTNSGES